MKSRKGIITAAVIAALIGTSGIIPVSADQNVSESSSNVETDFSDISGENETPAISEPADSAGSGENTQTKETSSVNDSADTAASFSTGEGQADTVALPGQAEVNVGGEDAGTRTDTAAAAENLAKTDSTGMAVNDMNPENTESGDSEKKDGDAEEEEEIKEEEETIQETIVLSDGSSFVIDLTRFRLEIEKQKDPRSDLKKITVMCGLAQAEKKESDAAEEAEDSQEADAAGESADSRETDAEEGKEPEQIRILTEMDENADCAGTIPEGGLVYILYREEKHWLYVESGEVRGFMKDVNVYDDLSVSTEVAEKGEESFELARAEIAPKDNPALLYTDTSVYQYHVPEAKDIVDYVMQYEGRQVKPETAVTQVLQYYEIVPENFKCKKEEFGEYAKSCVSPQDISTGDIVLFAEGYAGVCVGDREFLVPVTKTVPVEDKTADGDSEQKTEEPKKEKQITTLEVHTSEEIGAWPEVGYRYFTIEDNNPVYRYTTDNSFISKENTPVAYAVAVRLTEAGFSKAAASGIVGNLFAECGGCGSCDLQPASYSESGVIAAGGIAGWTDNASASGFTALQNYAASRGASWTDVYVQTDFLVSNIASRWVYAPEYGSSQQLEARLFHVDYSLEEFMRSDDAKLAAISFLGVYEDDLYNGTARWAGYTLDGWVQREVSVRTDLAGAVYNAFFLEDELSQG